VANLLAIFSDQFKHANCHAWVDDDASSDMVLGYGFLASCGVEHWCYKGQRKPWSVGWVWGHDVGKVLKL
jgi:hypothetical protein